jgi:hypothetical protein
MTMWALWLMRVIVRVPVFVLMFVVVLVRMTMFMWMGLRRRALCRLSIHEHVHLGRIDSATVNFTQVQHYVEMEIVNRLLQRFKRNPSIYQRSKKHVAADA